MNKFYLIFLAVFYLATGSITQAVENPSMPSDNTYAPTDPGRVLVLYDNPMEEHTVIRLFQYELGTQVGKDEHKVQNRKGAG